MDEREYFNATHPCLARPNRLPRHHHVVRVVHRSPLRRLLAKLARRSERR
jgi:hypothetical protein